MKNSIFKKHLIFWIVYPIVMAIITTLLVFFFDLTNGPLILFIFLMIGVAAFIALSIFLLNKKILFKIIAWFGFVAYSITMLVFSHPSEIYKSAVDFDNPEKTEVLTLANGKIQGVYNKDKTVQVYAGIPYAKAPVGDLRWKEPVDAENWDGVLDCSKFKAKCMQDSSNAITNTLTDIYAERWWNPYLISTPEIIMSEDCLYLNVWKPNTTETNLPVIVYIHGGSLARGFSGFYAYNGETTAKQNVIMITIAYRLGIFGYFAHEDLKAESPNHTTGNYGLLDQIKALEWVQNNIESFGGDKNNVTIAGESAGSSSVSALCTSPLAHGLFKRAIGESSSVVLKKAPHTFRELDAAYEQGNKFMKEQKCETIDELRKLSASQIVKTKYEPNEMTLDGYALNRYPYQVYEAGENNEEELLNGCNTMESDAFVIPTYLLSGQPQTNLSNIKERLVQEFGENHANQMLNLYNLKTDDDAFKTFLDIISVYWFVYPHYSWSKFAVNSGVKTYKYLFSKQNGYYKSYHSGEMVYCYGNLNRDPRTYRYNKSDYKLSNIMVKYRTNFAKTGDPNGGGNPEWNLYNPSDAKIIQFDNEVKTIDDPYKDLYPIFDEIMAE